MLTLYINVAGQDRRDEFMRSQLMHAKLDARRVDAITVDCIPAELVQRHCDPRRGAWLVAPELAAALSHLQAMGQFLESPHSHVLILEDDAVLSPTLPNFLRDFDGASTDIDVLRLETLLTPVRFADLGERVAGVQLLKAIGVPWGAAGYILNRRAAEFFRSWEGFFSRPVDLSLFDPFNAANRALKVRHSSPALIIQSNRLHQGSEVLPSTVESVRERRGSEEARHFWRRLPYTTWQWLKTEVAVGTQRTAQQWFYRGKKIIVPFAGD